MNIRLFSVLFVVSLLVFQGCGNSGRQAATETDPNEKLAVMVEESGSIPKMEGTHEDLEKIMESLKEKMGVIKYAADTGKDIEKVPAAALSIVTGMSGIKSFKPQKNAEQIGEFHAIGEKLAGDAKDIVEFLKKEGTMEEKKTYLAGKMEDLGASCGGCHDKFRK